MKTLPFALLVVLAVFVTLPAVAEDCVPPHLSLAESGLLDSQVELCPVVIRQGPDVTRLSSGEELFVWEAAIVDTRACEAKMVKVAFMPSAMDGAPSWDVGTSLWLLNHGAENATESGVLYVGLDGECSKWLRVVVLAEKDAWRDAEASGQLPDDLIVLEPADKDPAGFGLQAGSYWKFADAAYTTWIFNSGEDATKPLSWSELLMARKNTAAKGESPSQ